MPGKLVSSCVYNILFILILFNLILLVQALLVFNEGSCCILVPHPSTRRPDRLRSPFQVVRSTVQLLQPTGFIQRGNMVDSFHPQLQSDFFIAFIFAVPDSALVSGPDRECCWFLCKPSHHVILRKRKKLARSLHSQ